MERFHYLATLENPKSTISEAYRTLRTNLQFISPDSPIRTIVVTSSAPGEGKSGTAANLGVSLAQNGNRVVLVDADLRKPVLPGFFGLPKGKGVTNVLTGQMKLAEAVLPTEVDGLTVLASGPIPANPSELLASKAMDKLLAELSDAYEYVILDSPPCLAVADASILGSKSDGVILVAACNETQRQWLLQSKEQLTKVGARIIGVVVTKVDLGSRYGYYHYNYSYYEEVAGASESPGETV